MILDPKNGPYFVLWRGARKYPEAWFQWSSGNIFTKYPDKPTLQKMLQLANRLNAKVQGDEDEVYDVQEVEQYNDSFLDVYRNESAKKESGNSWLRRLLDLCRDRYP